MACERLVFSAFFLIIATTFSASVRQLTVPDLPDIPAIAGEAVPVSPPEPAAGTAAAAADPAAVAPATPVSNGTIPGPGTGGAVGATTLSTGTAWNFLSTEANGYTIFARTIRTTGYSGVLTSLHGGNGLTVFAPSDAAFASTLGDVGYTSDDGLYEAFLRVNSIDALFEIVGYHIVPKGYSLEMLQKPPGASTGTLMTYSGELLSVQNTEVQQVATSLPAPKIQGAAVLVDNAIVYPIDRVLWPFDVDVEKTRNMLSMTTPNASQPAAFLNTTSALGNGTELNCFPAYSTARRKDGVLVRMDQLAIGDEVLVDTHGTYSQVYLFTHRAAYTRSTFMKIRTTSPNIALTLSPGHYVYSATSRSGNTKQLTRADAVRVGDIVYGVSGQAEVTEVQRVIGNGLYAPHTYHGDIVVDNISCSAYTSALDANAAHASLVVIRALRYLEGAMGGGRWRKKLVRSDCVWDLVRKLVMGITKVELYGLQSLIST